MRKFVRFHATESEIELSQEFWKKRNSSAPYRAACTQIVALLLIMMCINFCAILYTRNRDLLTPKIPGKMLLQRHLLSDFYQKFNRHQFVIGYH